MSCQVDCYEMSMDVSITVSLLITLMYRCHQTQCAHDKKASTIECIVVDSIHYDLVDTYAAHHRKKGRVAPPRLQTGI